MVVGIYPPIRAADAVVDFLHRTSGGELRQHYSPSTTSSPPTARMRDNLINLLFSALIPLTTPPPYSVLRLSLEGLILPWCGNVGVSKSSPSRGGLTLKRRMYKGLAVSLIWFGRTVNTVDLTIIAASTKWRHTVHTMSR